MKKIKLFEGTQAYKVEKQINIWIETNLKFEVINVTSTLGFSSMNNKNLIVTVLYEDSSDFYL